MNTNINIQYIQIINSYIKKLLNLSNPIHRAAIESLLTDPEKPSASSSVRSSGKHDLSLSGMGLSVCAPVMPHHNGQSPAPSLDAACGAASFQKHPQLLQHHVLYYITRLHIILDSNTVGFNVVNGVRLLDGWAVRKEHLVSAS